MILRCSALPLAFACGGSIRTGEMTVSERSEAADLGTAVHDCMARFVAGASFGDLDYSTIAAAYNVNESDLRPLAWYGAKAWGELAPSMPGAVAEQPLRAELTGGHVLTGRLDVVAVSDATGAAIDWKSGRKDSNHYHQMMGYSLLVLDAHPDVTEVYASVVWLRDQEIETMRVTREQAVEWSKRLAFEVIKWRNRYNTGPHCVYCPRSHDCPAIVASQRRDIATLVERDCFDPIGGIAALEPADRVRMYRRAKAITTVCERVIAAVRANVAMSGGELAAEDGTCLRLTEENGGRKIDTLAAWPILSEMLSDEELAACTEVRISRVEETVARNAGRGKGALAKRVLNERLEAANAVTRTTREVLAEVRK